MNPYLFFGIGIPVVILIQIITIICNYHFEKKVTMKICRAGFKRRQFKDIELLYTSYKSIAKDQLIIAKLELQSKESSATFVKDTFNILCSIFTGVVLAFSALLISTSTSMINFISGNDEFKKDMSLRTKIINEFLKSISQGMDAIMITATILFIFSYLVILTLSTYNHRKNVVKKHLAIIEQAEKDRL